MIGHRWKVLAILGCALLINYIDRASLSIAAPYVMKEFRFSPAQMGIIFSSFFFAYPLFCFIGGYLSDVYGPKKTIAIAMVAWSLFAAGPAIAWGFASMIVFRVLFGAGEGPIGAVSNKMVNNWFPVTERAKAKGISESGMSIGAGVSGPIVGLIAVRFGWRVSFIVLAMLGLLWTVFWARIAADLPRQHPRVSPVELDLIEKGKIVSTSVTAERSLLYYLKQPTIVSVIVVFFATNYITYFFMTWFPSYLVMAHNLSIKNMSIVSVIPWLLGAVGCISGGTISDHLVKRGHEPIFARKIVISVAIFTAAIAVALCGFVKSAAPAVILMSIGLSCAYMSTPCYWAIIQDSVRSGSVGRVGGFVHFLSNLAGIFSPSVTGFIVQATGSFSSAFMLTGILAAVGALTVAVFAKPTRANAAAV